MYAPNVNNFLSEQIALQIYLVFSFSVDMKVKRYGGVAFLIVFDIWSAYKNPRRYLWLICESWDKKLKDKKLLAARSNLLCGTPTMQKSSIWSWLPGSKSSLAGCSKIQLNPQPPNIGRQQIIANIVLTIVYIDIARQQINFDRMLWDWI